MCLATLHSSILTLMVFMKTCPKYCLLAILTSSVCLTLSLLTFSPSAQAQVTGGLPAYLKLQPNTPGVQQTGHANLSGTVQAGQFVGGGTGLTSVNADLLDGLDSTAFLTGVPNPMTLSGNQPVSHIIKGVNSATASDSVGVRGASTAATGGTIGVWGESFSAQGLGLYGRVYATVGDNFGVWGQSPSTTGTGVYGVVTSTTGINMGVSGRTGSASGYGVYGLNTSSTGNPVAIFGEAPNSFGTGVRGDGANIGVSGNGTNEGVRGSSSVSGRLGVAGYSNATLGSGAGLQGLSSSPIGYGLWSVGDVHVQGDLVVSGSKTGFVSDVVLNVGDEPLESGDVVEIVGNDAPILGDVPVIAVRKAATADSRGVLGPVECALLVGLQTESKLPANAPAKLRYATPQYHVHKAEGSVRPGGYGRVVTLGSFRAIKVDASFGAVKPGDLLVSSPRAGFAMKSDDPKIGTVIGKALGGLQSGQGTVPVLVQSR